MNLAQKFTRMSITSSNIFSTCADCELLLPHIDMEQNIWGVYKGSIYKLEFIDQLIWVLYKRDYLSRLE